MVLLPWSFPLDQWTTRRAITASQRACRWCTRRAPHPFPSSPSFPRDATASTRRDGHGPPVVAFDGPRYPSGGPFHVESPVPRSPSPSTTATVVFFAASVMHARRAANGVGGGGEGIIVHCHHTLHHAGKCGHECHGVRQWKGFGGSRRTRVVVVRGGCLGDVRLAILAWSRRLPAGPSPSPRSLRRGPLERHHGGGGGRATRRTPLVPLLVVFRTCRDLPTTGGDRRSPKQGREASPHRLCDVPFCSPGAASLFFRDALRPHTAPRTAEDRKHTAWMAIDFAHTSLPFRVATRVCREKPTGCHPRACDSHGRTG